MKQALNLILKHYRLLWQFTCRNIHMKHRGAVLGVLWNIMGPLIQLALYTFVFGMLKSSSFGVLPYEDPIDFALGIYIGIIFYEFFAESFGMAPHIILTNANLVKKMVFPLEVLPLANVISNLYNLGINLCLLMIGLMIQGHMPQLDWFFLLLLLFPLIFLTAGFSWILSALGVYFRDLQHIVRYITLGLFWASGIFFAVHTVQTESPQAWAFLKYNPLIHLIDMARCAMLWDLPFNGSVLIGIWMLSLGVLFFGLWLFSRLKSAFADVL
jgi:lipopolysaccharide transport system permease protein